MRGAEAVIQRRTELSGRTHRAREPGLHGVPHGLAVAPQAVVAAHLARPCASAPEAASRTGRPRPARRATGRVTASSSGEPARRRRAAGAARRLQREREAQHADGAGRARRAARDARAGRAAARDERQAAQLVRAQMLDDRRPGRVELVRRGGRAPAGDAVRLLDERDGESLRLCRLRRGHEVRRRHASAGAVTENERAARPLDGVQMHVRRAVRRLDRERGHARTISTAPPASSCRTGRGNRRRCRTAAPSAPARTRRRDP